MTAGSRLQIFTCEILLLQYFLPIKSFLSKILLYVLSTHCYFQTISVLFSIWLEVSFILSDNKFHIVQSLQISSCSAQNEPTFIKKKCSNIDQCYWCEGCIQHLVCSLSAIQALWKNCLNSLSNLMNVLIAQLYVLVGN